MKRGGIALILTMVMTIGIVPLQVMGGVTAYTENFNSETEGRIISNTTDRVATWGISNPIEDLKYARVESKGSDGSDLYVNLITDQTSQGVSGNISMWRNFNSNGFDSSMTIQFDLKVSDHGADRWVQFRNGGTAANLAYPILSFKGGNGIFFRNISGAVPDEEEWHIRDIDEQWHTYRFDLIFDIPETGQQTLKGYMDGKLIAEEYRTDVVSINYFDFMQQAVSNNGQTAEMGIDNFNITDVPDLVDFNGLDAMIESAQALYDNSGGDISEVAKQVLLDVINRAREVRNDTDTSNEEVKAAITALSNAMEEFRMAGVINREVFDELRERIVLNLGRVAEGYENDLEDEVIKAAIQSSEEAVDKLLEKLVRDENRTQIFTDIIPTASSGAHITNTVRNLKNMALAYNQPGNIYYHDEELKEDILSAYDFVLTNWYHEGIAEVGNWWDWEIGVPKHSLDIFMIMYDEIPSADRMRYAVAYGHYLTLSQYETTQSGANRLDLAAIAARLGILSYNSELISRATNAIYQDLKYNQHVPTGKASDDNDGFYPDGSFIQHGNVAYTGSYGKDLFLQLVRYMVDYSGTQWEIDGSYKTFMYDIVYNSYAPLIYNGKMMDMVNGRAIVRANSNITIGYDVMNAMYQLSLISNEANREKIQSMLKQWIISDGYLYADPDPKNADKIISADLRKFMKESSVAPAGEMIYNRAYSLMDRVVHTGKNFGFGLSMFSSRILSYEQTGNENLKGWYTGSGMTYIYNSDANQYTDDYWYAVDMYRLPGTTVSTEPRVTDRWHGEYISEHDWVGASSLMGRYGSAGMMISQWDDRLKEEGNSKNELESNWISRLNGKKSWFMFDNEIVALGAGISNTTEFPVETIVDNRMIDSLGNWRFTINGVEELDSLSDQVLEKESVVYAHIDAGEASSSIGYYFPGSTTVNALKQSRTEYKNAVDGSYMGSDQVTKNFAALWIDHGTAPESASYEYVILPSVSGNDTAQYAESPDIIIISNTEEVQAAKDISIGVLGANFWEDREAAADIVTSYNRASVTLREEGKYITIAVSDPTLLQDRIRIDINKIGKAVISKDDRILVEMKDSKIELEINTEKAKGASFEVTLELEVPEEPQESEPETGGESESDTGEESQEETIEESETEMNIKSNMKKSGRGDFRTSRRGSSPKTGDESRFFTIIILIMVNTALLTSIVSFKKWESIKNKSH